MKRRHQRKYTPEFKDEAVKLAEELESLKAAAEKLGISKATIYNWLRSKNRRAQPPLVVEPPDAELKRLRRENEELKKANYILKRAAAFFSQDHLK